MKLHTLRLISNVPDGVGGAEAGMIDLIYSFLLQSYHCDYYGHITIHQVGEDLNEFVVKRGSRIDVNIRFPVKEFHNMSIHERNITRLEVVHAGLMKIAQMQKTLDISTLEKIREEILERNFEFELTYKSFKYGKTDQKIELLIQPKPDKFNFYVSFTNPEQLACKLLLYEGISNYHYIPILFGSGRWKNMHEFVIRDTKKEAEFHIFLNECRYEIKNLTNFPSPPFFELMKGNVSIEKRANNYQNYINSLPPWIAGAISENPN